MEQLYVIDGDPPEDDLAPALLGASYCLEAGDYLGLLESIALLAYQVGRVSSTALLNPTEAVALESIEAFQLGELRSMHDALMPSEVALSTSTLDMSSIRLCCQAATLAQRHRLAQLLSVLGTHKTWTLRREGERICRSREALFQASSIFVAWLHQRFQLHYMARDVTRAFVASPANNESVRPYMLRALSLTLKPLMRRTRLAGWRCDREEDSTVCATLLIVPVLRNPETMVNAMRDAVANRHGPFVKNAAAAKGVLVTDLQFESDEVG